MLVLFQKSYLPKYIKGLNGGGGGMRGNKDRCSGTCVGEDKVGVESVISEVSQDFGTLKTFLSVVKGNLDKRVKFLYEVKMKYVNFFHFIMLLTFINY